MVAPPQTYFIGRDGVIASRQIGELDRGRLRSPARAPSCSDEPAARRRSPSAACARATPAAPVVDGIDLEVAAGSIVALLGPNGAGKTTTVEIVEGYRRARRAARSGCSASTRSRDGRALRGRVGLMLQGGGIYPQARPLEILRLYARFYRDPLDPDALLEQVGLADVARRRATASCRAASASGSPSPSRSSAGPSSSCSTNRRPGWIRAPRPRRASSSVRCGTPASTVLLTTHELADVERLADRIAIVDRRSDRRRRDARPSSRRAPPPTAPDRPRVGAPPRRIGPRSRPPSVGAARTSGHASGLVDDGGLGRYRLVGTATPTRRCSPGGRGLVRGPRHPHRRAADDRSDARGTLPRADRPACRGSSVTRASASVARSGDRRECRIGRPLDHRPGRHGAAAPRRGAARTCS